MRAVVPLPALLLLLLAGCDRGPVAVRPGRFAHPELTVVLAPDGTASFLRQTAPGRTTRLMSGTWQRTADTGDHRELVEILVGSSLTEGYRRGDRWRFHYEEDRLVFHEIRGRDGTVLDAAHAPGGRAWVLARQ